MPKIRVWATDEAGNKVETFFQLDDDDVSGYEGKERAVHIQMLVEEELHNVFDWDCEEVH